MFVPCRLTLVRNSLGLTYRFAVILDNGQDHYDLDDYFLWRLRLAFHPQKRPLLFSVSVIPSHSLPLFRLTLSISLFSSCCRTADIQITIEGIFYEIVANQGY